MKSLASSTFCRASLPCISPSPVCASGSSSPCVSQVEPPGVGGVSPWLLPNNHRRGLGPFSSPLYPRYAFPTYFFNEFIELHLKNLSAFCVLLLGALTGLSWVNPLTTENVRIKRRLKNFFVINALIVNSFVKRQRKQIIFKRKNWQLKRLFKDNHL